MTLLTILRILFPDEGKNYWLLVCQKEKQEESQTSRLVCSWFKNEGLESISSFLFSDTKTKNSTKDLDKQKLRVTTKFVWQKDALSKNLNVRKAIAE